jgi:alcohol dehydrogenase (cytochrome c)
MHATAARLVHIAIFSAILGAAAVGAQQSRRAGPLVVTNQDLLDGLKDPTRWLMAGGNYSGQRHSPLTQITPQNVQRLHPEWTFQTEALGRFETTSLLLDNVLYVTSPAGLNNTAWALDARTGRQIWRYRRDLPSDVTACCQVNRGFGVLGDRLFMTTRDAHLIALDMRTGNLVWDATMEDYKRGFGGTVAPLVVKDKVIVGVMGAEYATRGFVDAYEAQTGKRAWRFYTVPRPGEPGSETWAGDSWMHGGGSIWQTGSYDPELNLVYYGVGNPGPDYHSESRKGDNLYTAAVVALDADTGKLRWYYQFTPHDLHDWDAVHVPVLGDVRIAGRDRKVLMMANRNGFFYTLDRATGELLVARPYIETSWAKEVNPRGRPVLLPGYIPDEKGQFTCPDLTGGTNANPPSFDPTQRLFFVAARETCAIFYSYKPEEATPGQVYVGGASSRTGGREKNWGALRAIDPATGERRWEFRLPNPSVPGLLTTASGLLFAGDSEGNLLALDSRAGKLLWSHQMGANLHHTAPTTYMVDGRQHLLVPAGATLTAWALPDVPRTPSTN